jgi:acetyl/propionyl-CoA carboxylase alpha subunit
MVPGLNEAVTNVDDAKKSAEKIGFPVLNQSFCWWWWKRNENCP